MATIYKMEVRVYGVRSVLCKQIPASSLTVKDTFLRIKPTTAHQESFREELITIIKSGIQDFYRPVMDPSVDFNRLKYKAGHLPAVGYSYNWWQRKADMFMPEHGSRLGTRSEYVAFLGCLMKELLTKGFSLSHVWHIICDDSRSLGHYRNSGDNQSSFESTGSRQVCEFYDLANTAKILSESSDQKYNTFWYAGGAYYNFSSINPLTDFSRGYLSNHANSSAVGWIVLS